MKTVFLWILYILFGYIAALVHKLYRISNDMNIWMKLLFVCSNMEVMLKYPFQKFSVEDVLAGIVAALSGMQRNTAMERSMVLPDGEHIKILGLTWTKRLKRILF